MAHCRHRGSSASLCLLIDFHVGDLHQERHGGSTLRLVSCHLIKINSESNVVMRHGECPRYADVPCAWLDWQCTPALRSFRRSLGYPSLLPTDSRRLEWQFSDPLSTHQNKVRHVTKESQGMDLAWGISPKFEGLSGDCVCFWRLRTFPTAPRMSAVGDYRRDTTTYASNVCF